MSELSQPQREFLQHIAQLAVAAAAGDETPPDIETLAAAAKLSLEGILGDKRGVFVTLTSGGRLRGCIGYIEGFKPLAQAVVENGRNAAVGDPRFQPVEVHELDSLDVEVSVLTPLIEVNTHKEIQVGKHGVFLEKSGRQAVFLPQVATEQGWDLPTTLTHLALKAGLGPDEWRQGAVFRVFEADVF